MAFHVAVGGGAKERQQGGWCGRAVVPSEQVGTEAVHSAAGGGSGWRGGPSAGGHSGLSHE